MTFAGLSHQMAAFGIRVKRRAEGRGPTFNSKALPREAEEEDTRRQQSGRENCPFVQCAIDHLLQSSSMILGNRS
jgi:hypothetical protein